MGARSVIDTLFRAACENGELQYIYTLVRVTGCSYDTPDPLIVVKKMLRQVNSTQPDVCVLSQYRHLLSIIEEPLSLLANLLSCANGTNYRHIPFFHLYQGDVFNRLKPTAPQMVKDLISRIDSAQMPELRELVESCFPDHITSISLNDEAQLASSDIIAVLRSSVSFLRALIRVYSRELLSYRNLPRFRRAANNAIMEFLVNERKGLHGFRMHFYGGSTATFNRTPTSTDCINVNPVGDIQFSFSVIDSSHGEWLVNGRRLHELGMSGRYNPLGKWRLIVYPGDITKIQEEILATTDDRDVQGVLFYIMCTGYKIIEFVVRTAVELPTPSITLGDRFHLWKCTSEEDGHLSYGMCIYDGWFDVDSVEPEYLRAAIADIGVGVSRLAFAYDVPVSWRLKYLIWRNKDKRVVPTNEDLDILDSLLRDYPAGDEAVILNAALDWYNQAKIARNAFTSFLCYYIAIESIVIAVAESDASFDLAYAKESKAQRKTAVMQCIQAKHNELYEKDPIKFVTSAYFNCVVGLKEKTQRITELVFGSGHRYIRDLFVKADDGYSLHGIRSDIAHGRITLLNNEHERLVWQRLHQIANISREFLSRLAFRLSPDESVPSWRRHCIIGVKPNDPRDMLVVNDLSMIPESDWRIKPEWCEPEWCE